MHVDHSDPTARRQMLQARVSAHVSTMNDLGLHPNRTVSLGGTVFPGWLLDDPYTQITSRRWLLLSDGDVWCEAAYMAGPWRHEQGTAFGWLTEVTPSLESLLDLSLDEAHGGGSGLMASPSSSDVPCRVADRRGQAERRSDTDRRSGHEVLPEIERRQGDRRAVSGRRRHA